jgi:hypothetical protein
MHTMTKSTEDHPNPPPDWAQRLMELLTAAGAAAVGYIVLSGLGSVSSGPQGIFMLGNPADLCRSVHDGFLSGRLYGAVERAIEWRGTDMRCEGGARPDDDGFRLVFAAPGDVTSDRLVFVIGITGILDGLSGSERAANVTIIDEKTGRFFSSGRQERCWTTVTSAIGDEEKYAIDGQLYCSGSLPSLSDTSSVSLSEFRYSGRLKLDAP